ncbi:uncharacterized protein LOC143214797 isoform X5 [Lasioglossum baleicum]|uniref:uncharacterized protein LOC143214797 isoform X5 n=1 Tax=Lasioglossum baleicum TaxID=434251 RepID=UPI003FCD6328
MRGDLQEDKQLRYNYDRFNNEQTLDAYANIGSYELINGNWSASQRFIWYVKDSVKIRMKGNLINDSNGSGTCVTGPRIEGEDQPRPSKCRMSVIGRTVRSRAEDPSVLKLPTMVHCLQKRAAN